MKPTTKFENELEKKLLSLNIETDITKRWENGIEHHPKSVQLAKEIATIDWLYGNDSLCFKFGGDGDNGEHLIYLLDILFDFQDKQTN
jgi:hypothetical protein